ncbi:uncharacterized protein LAESUDRAFT_643679, partial [Laetiporus sulphureus 93-53]
LIFFEYIVTFSEEVYVIWQARLTTVTAIFALNHYLLVVQGINFALDAIWWHTPLVSRCDSNSEIFDLKFMKRLIDKLLGFSAFRTYAVSGHQIIPALLVLLLGLAPVGANLVIVFVARICPAASDLIVVLLTWFKTFRLAIEVRKLQLRGSISTVLMRDGEYVWLSWVIHAKPYEQPIQGTLYFMYVGLCHSALSRLCSSTVHQGPFASQHPRDRDYTPLREFTGKFIHTTPWPL